MSTQPVAPKPAPTLVSLSPKVTAAFCRQYAGGLKLDGCTDVLGCPIEPVRFLWALSGNESSFGRNLTPRFEPAYFKGGSYYQNSPEVQALVEKYGHAAACSYGPWQLLLVNAIGCTPDQLQSDIGACARATIDFINREIVGRQQARTMDAIADAWNTGNWKDRNVPWAYIHELTDYYLNFPMPLG